MGATVERTALIFYLENVRDLEVVKDKVLRLWNYEYSLYQRDCNNHPIEVMEPQLTEKCTGNIIGSLIALFVVSVLDFKAIRYCIALQGADFWGRLDYLLMVPIVVLLSIGVIWCLVYLIKFINMESEAKKSNSLKEEQYKKDCLTAISNKEYLNKISEEWNRKNHYYESERDRIDAVLKKFYDMNIIPLQYRKLSAVCYLYDYMSSSQESYQMALISNQIEDGIRRIEAKLDEIIDRLDAIIWEQKVIRDDNRRNVERQIDQNNRMIDSLKNLEDSSKNIEEYSRLSANYNEAQAIIGMAYYLKN